MELLLPAPARAHLCPCRRAGEGDRPTRSPSQNSLFTVGSLAENRPELRRPAQEPSVSEARHRRETMTPERWKRVQEVFNGAVELPPTDRERFLQAACRGDAELRKEVDSLIASHEDASSKFPALPSIEMSAPSVRSFGPGTRLGSYEVLAPLGAG